MSWLNELSLFEREKLEADPFYYSMVKAGFSYKELLLSGWLNHKYSLRELNEKMGEKVTQFNKDKVFILLNTGSYAPAHEGHIAQMKSAYAWVKKNYPEFNIKMILSPSHDKYTLTKTEDIKPWNINARVDRLYELMKKDNDLTPENFGLDLWEGCICEYPVNFTDVIVKFMKDLSNLNYEYKIGYVFGSDLEEFINPFVYLDKPLKEKVFAFCVRRDGYDTKINKKDTNIIYLDVPKEYSAMASRKIRKEVPVKERAFYTEDMIGSYYGVRADNELALKEWVKKYPSETCLINEAYDEFLTSLCGIFEKFTGVKSLKIDLNVQCEIVEKLDKKDNIINLDIGTNHLTKHKVDYTRLFIPASDQLYTLNMSIRPEVLKSEIICNIAPGEYAFMDDDIASGRTFVNISNKLKRHGVIFNKKYNLMKLYFEKMGLDYNLFDIVDGKDFLLGSYSGGLLCEIDAKEVRLPYFMSFINLYTRASIKPSLWLDFQKEIDLLNKKFFTKCDFIKKEDINEDLRSIIDHHKQQRLYDFFA